MAQLSCQKCRAPLKIDGTLEDLNPASFKILADAAPTLAPKSPEAPRSAAAKERRQQYGEASQQAGAPIHKRRLSLGQKGSEKMKPDMSYIMLNESQLAYQIQTCSYVCRQDNCEDKRECCHHFSRSGTDHEAV
jgi:beclin 1